MKQKKNKIRRIQTLRPKAKNDDIPINEDEEEDDNQSKTSKSYVSSGSSDGLGVMSPDYNYKVFH